MTHTVEDTLEILAGLVPRSLNIRLDSSERKLIQSIAGQVQKGLALTDRQLDLSLAKIDKYREGLVANSVDVDRVIKETPLRHPLREVDRTQKIFFSVDEQTNEQKICVKFLFSKKLEEIWGNLKTELVGTFAYDKNVRSVTATEFNLYKIVSTFSAHGFEIDRAVMEIYEKIDKIVKNPQNFQVHVAYENQQCVIKNGSKHVIENTKAAIETANTENLLVGLYDLKKYGIFHKNAEIVELIEKFTDNDLLKKVVSTPDTRFRLIPEKFDVGAVVEIISYLNQWPLLVVLDDNPQIYEQTVGLVNALSKVVNSNEMNVFFRLDNGQMNHAEFNQFVRENHLNNYIDEKIKVVFITKNKIPKPLLKAEWKPQTALVLANYAYGKTSAYLNDLSTVYYYNSSITVRHDRIKGSTPIVEL